MSKITSHYIQVDEKQIQITIQVKPYFNNDTLQPIYIYDVVKIGYTVNEDIVNEDIKNKDIVNEDIVNENNLNGKTSIYGNIITYYIRGASNQIYTVINNYYLFHILKKKYTSLLPDITKNFPKSFTKPINL